MFEIPIVFLMMIAIVVAYGLATVYSRKHTSFIKKVPIHAVAYLIVILVFWGDHLRWTPLAGQLVGKVKELFSV